MYKIILSCALSLLMLLASAPAPAQCPGPCLGDLNGDGDVSLEDLAELLSRYGTDCEQAWTPDEYTVALWYLNGNGMDFGGNGNDLTVKTDRVGWCDDAPHCRGVLMGVDPWSGGCGNSDGGAITAPGTGCAYPGSGDWTVEAWIFFPSNSAYYEIITHYSQHTAGHEPFKLTITNGVAEFMIQDAANDSAAASMDISLLRGQWLHIAGVYHYQQDVSLFINGGRVAYTATAVVPESLPGYDVYLGGSYCGTTTGLKIDEVRISSTGRYPCTGTIAVGDLPVGVSINGQRDRAYVSCHLVSAVYEIDMNTCTLTHIIPTGAYPHLAATNNAGNRLYVTTNANDLKVFSLDTYELINAAPTGDTPVSVALSPDERRAYVSCHVGNALSIINIDENEPAFCTEIERLPVASGQSIGDVALSPDGAILYVAAGSGSNTVTLFSMDSTNDVYERIDSTPSEPDLAGIVTLSPGRSRLYCAKSHVDEILIIDTTDPLNDDLWQRLQVCDGPSGIAVSPDETRIYIVCENSDEIWVFDAASLTQIDSIPTENNPQRAVCHPDYPDGSLLYVTLVEDDALAVIDALADLE